MKPSRLDAAHRHLVLGYSLAKAGEPAGVTRQNVHDSVQRILAHFGRLDESIAAAQGGVRKGWVRITVDVPADMAVHVRRFAVAVAHKVPLAEATLAHTPKARVASKKKARVA
jgi:hypothetical protein